jgi:hypothetical protein
MVRKGRPLMKVMPLQSFAPFAALVELKLVLLKGCDNVNRE